MKTIEQIFKNNLIRLRGARSQADVAEAAGIPLRSYQRCEYGDIPHGKNRRAIAKALKVPESALFVDPEEYQAVSENDVDSALEMLTRFVNAHKMTK